MGTPVPQQHRPRMVMPRTSTNTRGLAIALACAIALCFVVGHAAHAHGAAMPMHGVGICLTLVAGTLFALAVPPPRAELARSQLLDHASPARPSASRP